MKKAVNIASLVGIITILLLIIPNQTQAVQIGEVEPGLTNILAVQKNEDGIHMKGVPYSGGRELDGTSYYEGQKPPEDEELAKYYGDLYYDGVEMSYYEGQLSVQKTEDKKSIESTGKSTAVALGFFIAAVVVAVIAGIGFAIRYKILRERREKEVSNAADVEMQANESEGEII